ncbi:hypothetical protein CTI14_71610, partial [Methylobacterium radiotolerans]
MPAQLSTTTISVSSSTARASRSTSTRLRSSSRGLALRGARPVVDDDDQRLLVDGTGLALHEHQVALEQPR